MAGQYMKQQPRGQHKYKAMVPDYQPTALQQISSTLAEDVLVHHSSTTAACPNHSPRPFRNIPAPSGLSHPVGSTQRQLREHPEQSRGCPSSLSDPALNHRRPAQTSTRQCQFKHCATRATFGGAEEAKARFCCTHKRAYDAILYEYHCEVSGCQVQTNTPAPQQFVRNEADSEGSEQFVKALFSRNIRMLGDSPHKKLLQSAHDGALAACAKALCEGADVNTTDEVRVTR